MYERMSVNELKSAAEDLYKAIQNEKIWMFGSAGNAEEECMHAENVDKLRSELKYVLELIEARR